ncbi:MAG: hypothetical protein IV090_12965 [Candidatus Sericytochromatia bacterium]|nr:hypothetical protein [Candidatus Sericytochromatia bacterium]
MGSEIRVEAHGFALVPPPGWSEEMLTDANRPFPQAVFKLLGPNHSESNLELTLSLQPMPPIALSELPEHMPKGYHKLFAGWETLQSELIELPDKRQIYLLSGRFQLQGQTLAMQQYFIPGRDSGGFLLTYLCQAKDYSQWAEVFRASALSLRLLPQS